MTDRITQTTATRDCDAAKSTIQQPRPGSGGADNGEVNRDDRLHEVNTETGGETKAN